MPVKSGKDLKIKELSLDQRRQLIDTQQVYETWRLADIEFRRRFIGSMRWAKRNGTEYLLRKTGKAETSLGPRDAQTEAAYQAFFTGREQTSDRLKSLATRLDERARVNVALALGRVPQVAAQILRKCDEHGLLGEQLFVLGTNAVYAYEALAGVHLQSGLMATGDIDLHYDARRHISLALDDVRASGLVGLLRKVDRSFSPVQPRAFRAANDDGYLVDLIRPEAKDVFRDRRPAALTDLADDLEAASIFGLDWLISSPRLEAVAIDERGYPVRMVVIDPRAFALHKVWISQRADREPAKAARDLQQAEAVAAIASQYLQRPFESSQLDALPKALRELAPNLIKSLTSDLKPSVRPNW
jgi:hypothetical protein